MYQPVQSARLFAVDTKYADVNWNDFRSVVSAFRRKLEYWYVLPGLELMRESHFGFSQAAVACLLIDCLSQYEAGIPESDRNEFKRFLRRHWPDLAVEFPIPIRAEFKGNPFSVEDGADVIYHGIRCGILHEAHGAIYTGLIAQKNIVDYHRSGLAEYADGSGPCPVVTLDPGRLFDAIHQRLDAYILELTNPDSMFNQLRLHFQRKLEKSYGVSISITL